MLVPLAAVAALLVAMPAAARRTEALVVVSPHPDDESILAADTIHSDLARGFVRAEVWAVDDLLRLGSERDLKAQGLNHIVGKDYIVKDGDEIFIRSGV